MLFQENLGNTETRLRKKYKKFLRSFENRDPGEMYTPNAEGWIYWLIIEYRLPGFRRNTNISCILGQKLQSKVKHLNDVRTWLTNTSRQKLSKNIWHFASANEKVKNKNAWICVYKKLHVTSYLPLHAVYMQSLKFTLLVDSEELHYKN